MARINQIHIRYVAPEDRIMLRLNTEDASEFRFWITRRYAKLLAANLLQLLRSPTEVREHQQAEVQDAVMSFKHEAALSNADFAKVFKGQPKSMPLGPDPVLLSKLTVKKTAEGNPLLCMYPAQGQGVDLALQQPLLHSVSKLFADALQSADWGVEFSLQGRQAIQPDTEKPMLLN